MKLFASKLFVVLALSLSSTFSLAQQNYVFKVLATGGKPEIKKANTWAPLRSGASLFDADEIRLGANTYVGLIHTSGRQKELMKAGTFKVKDLASSLPKGTTVMLKYFEFMSSKNSDEAKQNRLVAVGAVTRTSFKQDILVRLPENHHADMLGSRAVISWESKTDSVGPFIVTVQNLSGDMLLSVETSTPVVSIDFNSPKLSGESYFLVDVKNKNNKSLSSDQYLIKRLQKEGQKKFNDEIKALTNELKESSAMQKIMLAAFYETNFLLIDAIVAYEEAIKLAPEVSFYQEAYEEFLLRNRLKFQQE